MTATGAGQGSLLLTLQTLSRNFPQFVQNRVIIIIHQLLSKEEGDKIVTVLRVITSWMPVGNRPSEWPAARAATVTDPDGRASGSLDVRRM